MVHVCESMWVCTCVCVDSVLFSNSSCFPMRRVYVADTVTSRDMLDMRDMRDVIRIEFKDVLISEIY